MGDTGEVRSVSAVVFLLLVGCLVDFGSGAGAGGMSSLVLTVYTSRRMPYLYFLCSYFPMTCFQRYIEHKVFHRI